MGGAAAPGIPLELPLGLPYISQPVTLWQINGFISLNERDEEHARHVGLRDRIAI